MVSFVESITEQTSYSHSSGSKLSQGQQEMAGVTCSTRQLKCSQGPDMKKYNLVNKVSASFSFLDHGDRV